MQPEHTTLTEPMTSAFGDCCPNGAAIIDTHGTETPITEAMIRRALEALDTGWINFYQPSAGHEVLVSGVAA